MRYSEKSKLLGAVRARLNWRTRRGRFETGTALATAAFIVARFAGTVTLVVIGLTLALPSVAQASPPKPDAAPQAGSSSGSGRSPDPSPHAQASSQSSTNSAPSGQQSAPSSALSQQPSQAAVLPSTAGTPELGLTQGATGTHTTKRTTTTPIIQLRATTRHRTASSTRQRRRTAAHATIPQLNIGSLWHGSDPFHAQTAALTSPVSSHSDGLVLLFGALGLTVLVLASGSLLRVLVRMEGEPRI